MRIAIDCRFIFNEISGIGKYTETLLEGLIQLPGKHNYILFFNDASVLKRTKNKLSLDSYNNIELKLVNYNPFEFKNLLCFPKTLKKEQIDLLHSPEFFIPLFCKTKIISTIHDIILICNPKFSPKAKKSRLIFVYKFLTKIMSKKATRIITVSNHSKNDLHKLLKIPKEKIGVVYNGVDKTFSPVLDEKEKQKLKEKYGYANNKIIFYVGRQDPYKNVKANIDSFILYKKTTEDKNTKLVILGKKDNRYPENYNFAKRSEFSNDIIFTGYVDDSTVYDYFKMSDLLLFLSLYEGFGLPVAESMASGVAVLCSDRASLPEVVAHPYTLTNPDDIKKTSEKIAEILNNNDLYKEIVDAGLKKAKDFSSLNMAKNVLAEYEKI